MEGIAPRLVRIHPGNVFTTNMVNIGTGVEYEKGQVLKLKKTSRNTLELDKTGTIATKQFVIVKVYTMPDGQPGLKLQCVK